MLRLLYALVVDLLLVLFYPLLALRRARAAPRDAYLELEVDGAVVELPRTLPFWDRRPRPLALEAARRGLRLAALDARVAGIVVRLKHLNAGSATATSLRDVLLSFRAAQKRVIVSLPDGAGTRELLVASAADRVLLGPETHIMALGFAVQSPYLKAAFDRVGVEPEVFARGRYKTAGEPLVSRSMSGEQREQVGAVLDTAWDTLAAALAEGRKVDRERAERWIHDGPWTARDALAQGIVDGIVHDDDLDKELLPQRSDAGAVLIPLGRYLRRRQIRWRPLFRRPRIGVVEVHGPIVSRHMGLLPVAVEDEVRSALERAREDRSVRGVLVHVDSRGGSALASERMLHELRRVAGLKPVVAYFGDAAASGGYMVGLGAHAIVAQPTTVTGSIGVVAARLALGPLLDRLGIHVEVVKRGDHADMFGAHRQLDAGERARYEALLDDVYRSFVERVAEGRGRSADEIEPLAGGRVWSGRDAARHGLVDRLGSFDIAVEELRRRVGARAEDLQPALISPRRLPRPALPLPRLVLLELAGLAEPALVEPLCLALGAPRETALLYCPIAER
jgi:protease-4